MSEKVSTAQFSYKTRSDDGWLSFFVEVDYRRFSAHSGSSSEDQNYLENMQQNNKCLGKEAKRFS